VRAVPAAKPDTTPARRAVLIVEGNSREIAVPDDQTVLDAALAAGLDLPFACKGGMCCTCRAKIVSGEARMDVNYSLQPWEIAAGFILTCQARLLTDRIVLDYDAV
jgi:ring-1,2-phenylacetyl-CoA epoxidase subunit PaaE